MFIFLKAFLRNIVSMKTKDDMLLFEDFKKAFDSIWHEGLFLKLQRLEIVGNFYDVIKSMYKDATAAGKYNRSEISASFPIK